MKYIILESELGMTFPFIFSNRLVHSEVAENMRMQISQEMKLNTKIISAGFCNVFIDCFGESESLQKKSLPNDSIICTYNDSIGAISIDNFPKLKKQLQNQINKAFNNKR